MARTLYERQCDGKLRYESMSEAKREAKRIFRAQKNRPNLHGYHCEFCGGYHVGTEGRYTAQERAQLDREIPR
jgi:hypothetical protein